MFTIFLSESNLNTLISGLLVLSGVAIAPLIAFFTTLFTKRHEEKLVRKREIKPLLDKLSIYMADLLSLFDSIYDKYNQKNLVETAEIFNENPLDLIDSLDTLYKKVKSIGQQGYMLFPEKTIRNVIDFVWKTESLISYTHNSLFAKDGMVDFSSFSDKRDFLRDLFNDFIDNSRKYLGV